MDKKEKKIDKTQLENAEKKYPGAEVNSADNDADTPKLVDERTKALNNNPRNEGKLV